MKFRDRHIFDVILGVAFFVMALLAILFYSGGCSQLTTGAGYKYLFVNDPDTIVVKFDRDKQKVDTLYINSHIEED